MFGPASSVFRVLLKPVLLEPEKAQLVMTIACLHTFLRRSCNSAAIYTPPGTFVCEENGRVIEGTCRAMSNENMTSLIPMRKFVRKPTSKAKEIRGRVSSLFSEWRKSRMAK